MPIEKWSEQIHVVRLADDPVFSDDLDLLSEQLDSLRQLPDLVLDLASVMSLNSSNLAALLKLRKRVIMSNGKLVLCCIRTQVWGTFLVTGLDKIFTFADDVTTALATLQLK
jgi:anti-anti-sigma factor